MLSSEATSGKDDNHLRTPLHTRNHTDGKQPSRKGQKPQKTPVHCSSSIVLKFKLIDGTPVPSLKILTTGSHWYLKARRRLFTHSDTKCSATRDDLHWCESTQYSPINDTADFVLESSEETDMYGTNSAEEKPNSAYKVKICASCKTKKTPLWRDSEDGTPYCNACGIRFKKYRISCPICSYIPRKDEKLGNLCCRCGSSLSNYSNK